MPQLPIELTGGRYRLAGFKRASSNETQCRPRAQQACRSGAADDATSQVSAAGDSDDGWLCPGWDGCTGQFADCRHSLCCASAPFFKGHRDVPFLCMRRPHLYYAQCRPDPQPFSGAQCADGDSWLCPGWERCAGAGTECTLSRCCADAGHSCYLNNTLLEASGRWEALCLPTVNITNTTELASHLKRRGWLSPAVWMARRDRLSSALAQVEDHYPISVAATVFVAVGAALCVLACACVHRRRMGAQLRRLEAELSALREEKLGGGAASHHHDRGRHERGELTGLVASSEGEELGDLPPGQLLAHYRLGGQLLPHCLGGTGMAPGRGAHIGMEPAHQCARSPMHPLAIAPPIAHPLAIAPPIAHPLANAPPIAHPLGLPK